MAASPTVSTRVDFRRVFEATTLPYLLLHPDLSIAGANDAYLSATLTERDKIIGRGVFEVFPDNPHDPEANGVRNLTASFQRVIARKQPDRMAVQKYDIPRPESPSGEFEVRYWSPLNSPILAPDGELELILHQVEDVTERVFREARIRELEQGVQRFREIADATPQIVWTATPDGTLDWYNDVWYDYTGTPRGTTWDGPDSPVHPDDLGPTAERWHQSIVHGIPHEIEHRIRRADGEYRWHLARAVPLRTPDGQIRRWVGSNTDVHDQKALEVAVREKSSELARSNQELERFAHIASHDLKEPLRMVTSFLQLLEKRTGGQLDGPASEYLRYALEGAGRMRTLIDEILSFAKAKTPSPPRSIVALSDALDDALHNLRVTIDENDARIEAVDLPSVAGERVQFTQLFQNLIANAIKYRRVEPPRIRIHCEERYGEWLFRVDDNGIGIPMTQAERIFEPFVRLHTQSEYPGTGLGLAACRRVLEHHGGKIWVESVPGEGSTFFFTLPLNAETREATEAV